MFSYLFSIFGVFTLLLGALTFLLLPVVPKATGRAKFLARFYLWLMARTLKRGAFVLSEHGDLLLKRMSFDDRGVELMDMGGDDPKAFEDPDDARHAFYGIPFALADEVHGILFDPRHAAVGARKQTHDRANRMFYKATESESGQYNVMGWVRGVLELPKDTHELVDLSAMRHLVTGSEQADHPNTVARFREYAEAPYKDGTSASRLLILIAAIVGPFIILGIMASQLGGSGPSSSIGFGTVLGILASTTAPSKATLKRAAGTLAVLLVFAVPLGLIAVFVSPVTALWVVLTYGLGFVLVAGLMLLLGQAVGGIPRLMLRMALMGYDKPVFEWTPRSYQLREHRELDDTAPRPTWYGLQGADVGFTYTPSAESFPDAAIDSDELRARQDVLADGSGTSTNLPAGSARYPELQRAGYLAAFVPDKPDDGSLYINTAHVFGAFTHAAVGLKSHRFLVRAKKEYGDRSGIGDKTFVYSVAGLAALSFASGIGVFFLL
mgnify:CR=1 FL=1